MVLDEVVSLDRIKPKKIVQGTGAPIGAGAQATKQRGELGDFLQGRFQVPGPQLENVVKSLSMAERVYLELEIRDRRKAIHNFEWNASPFNKKR